MVYHMVACALFIFLLHFGIVLVTRGFVLGREMISPTPTIRHHQHRPQCSSSNQLDPPQTDPNESNLLTKIRTCRWRLSWSVLRVSDEVYAHLLLTAFSHLLHSIRRQRHRLACVWVCKFACKSTLCWCWC